MIDSHHACIRHCVCVCVCLFCNPWVFHWYLGRGTYAELLIAHALRGSWRSTHANPIGPGTRANPLGPIHTKSTLITTKVVDWHRNQMLETSMPRPIWDQLHVIHIRQGETEASIHMTHRKTAEGERFTDHKPTPSYKPGTINRSHNGNDSAKRHDRREDISSVSPRRTSF